MSVRRSTFLLLLTVGSASLVLSGCTVETGGRVGLTLTPGGEVAAVLVACTGYPDGVTVYQRQGARESSVVEREAAERITDSATIALSKGPLEAATEQLALTPGARGTIYGWSEDNRWSASHVDFTSEDIRALRQDEVWFTSWVSDDEPDVGVFVPIADFPTVACSDF